MFGFIKKIFGSAQDRMVSRFTKIVAKVNEWDEKYKSLSDDQLRAKTQEFRDRIQKGETVDQILPEAFGVVKNACRRHIGTEVHVSGYNQKWDMVPYDVQVVGAIALHNGCVSEMMTGEGKTLTAVMPLYLNSLTGRPVHLVTVNDYLVKRDCEWVGSILRWLGVTTGTLMNETPMEQRHEVYAADVVYGTSSEFGFDYLRDNSMATSKEEQVQRGFYYAIVDEVDSILIDEARTPLIISGPSPVSKQMYDELKSGVNELVKRQRDLCTRYASDAGKILDFSDRTMMGEKAKDKEQSQKEKEALRKLWLVSKGTPRNKILKKARENPDYRAAIDEWDLYYYSDQNKEERAEALADLYIVIDEKSSDYELTDKGIVAWEECTGGKGSSSDFVMIDISYEYLKIDENHSLNSEERMEQKLRVQEDDGKRKERAHNLRQMLRAHLLMEKDVDYIIQESKIVIVDENTGRPQPGRRFSDGLHQAIEAKEGVEIQRETQTYATITLQNYFRMYEKIAGMTGTASTEANEIKQIYKMDVLAIPTQRPCVRVDFNDEIYMTEREKYNAILKEVREIHAQGRPILIGSDSVEVSEKLSRIFKQNKLPHTVLNAKYNEMEAEIVANAGQNSAITIATNMAGRGTDIKLGENVAKIGGLYVIGTTRHQSRRIDRQLRGRCARQGDPGSSKFFVSFEDSLLRLFASPRMTSVLQRFRPPEGEPISAGILNKSIETAQKRVEQRNYTIRKHTLEYDDVMNKQRKELYDFRNDVLRREKMDEIALELLDSVCAQAAQEYFRNRSEEGGWDPEGYRQWLMTQFPITFPEGYFDEDHLEAEEMEKRASTVVCEAFKKKLDFENTKVQNAPRSPVNEALRHLMVRKIDQNWQEHLLEMDHLRSEVQLRSLGQRDPLMEFKQEAFTKFDEFGRKIQKEITHDLFKFQMIPADHPTITELLSRLQMERNRSLVGEMNGEMNGESAPSPQQPIETRSLPITVPPKVGRNDPCPCGSGKKYKNCCMEREENIEE
jgi:preprotein translocase subunit SecA